jgi:NADH:ubiquinone oxidoreductase subunit 2 (subunit N)
LYSNQPSNITQWLLIVPKLGNLLFLLNLYTLFGLHNYNTYTNGFLLLVGILSMLVGSISLLSQVKVKRFFAYSSICHVGF